MRRWVWLVMVVVLGCAGGQTVADAPGQAAVSSGSESGSRADAEPNWVTLTVDEDAMHLDDREVAALEDGRVLDEDFAGPTDYLIEPLYDAIVSARRTAIIYGESSARQLGAAVEMDVDVPVRTFLAIQITLARAGVDGLTLQSADISPLPVAVSTDFTGPRPRSARAADEATADRDEVVRHHSILGAISSGSGKSGSLDELFKADASSGDAAMGLGRGAGGLDEAWTDPDDNRSQKRVVRPRYIPPGPHCDAMNAPESAEDLAQVWVRLSGGPASVWVSESDTQTKRELRDFEVLPIWQLYHVLVDYRAKYPAADTLVVWVPRALPSSLVARAASANCRLPQARYDSSTEFVEARRAAQTCEPLFETTVISDGTAPTTFRH